MGVTISTGSAAFQSATDVFIMQLRNQVAADLLIVPIPLTSPPRGVREFVNKFVKLWHFTDRWRSHIVSSMPASIQAVIAAVDVVILLIEQQNHPGPE